MTHKERYERRRRIAERIRRGDPAAAVALDEGVTGETVRNACHEHGVGEPTAPRMPSRTLRILAELLNTRDSQTAIAGRLGVSKQRVSQAKEDAVQAGIRILAPEGKR